MQCYFLREQEKERVEPMHNNLSLYGEMEITVRFERTSSGSTPDRGANSKM